MFMNDIPLSKQINNRGAARQFVNPEKDHEKAHKISMTLDDDG